MSSLTAAFRGPGLVSKPLDGIDGGGFRIQDHLDARGDVGTVQGSLEISGFPDAGT